MTAPRIVIVIVIVIVVDPISVLILVGLPGIAPRSDCYKQPALLLSYKPIVIVIVIVIVI